MKRSAKPNEVSPEIGRNEYPTRYTGPEGDLAGRRHPARGVPHTSSRRSLSLYLPRLCRRCKGWYQALSIERVLKYILDILKAAFDRPATTWPVETRHV